MKDTVALRAVDFKGVGWAFPPEGACGSLPWISYSLFRITSLAKASPGALILGLVVLVALGKCMGDRPSVPQYATYATAPEAPSLPTAPTPTPSALPDPPRSTVIPPVSPAAPAKPNLTRTLTPSPRKVTAQSLNMRKGPGTGYDRYGDPLPQGAIVTHTGDAREVEGETWAEVSYQGRLGWVSGRFLGPVDTVAPPPSATATTRAVPAARPATLFEVPEAEAPAAPAMQSRKVNSGFSCGGKRTCGQMNSCAEANFYLNQCGLYRLDRDRDGRPCEAGPC